MSWSIPTDISKEAIIKMTELKTLKDIPNKRYHHIKYISRQCVEVDRLKQEAIKWVKHFNKDNEMEGLEYWVGFFNLTEEDLK